MDRNQDENICEEAQERKLDQYIDHLNYSKLLLQTNHSLCLLSH